MHQLAVDTSSVSRAGSCLHSPSCQKPDTAADPNEQRGNPERIWKTPRQPTKWARESCSCEMSWRIRHACEAHEMSWRIRNADEAHEMSWRIQHAMQHREQEGTPSDSEENDTRTGRVRRPSTCQPCTMPSSLLPEIASDQSTCLETQSLTCTDVHMRGSLSDIHLPHTLCSVNAWILMLH